MTAVERITVPALGVHALDDPLAPYEDARAMVARIPGSRWVRVEHGGHIFIHKDEQAVATGVHYRRLEAEGVERLIGAGVFYGSSPSEAPLYRDGEVVVVGGANSAGQAALHLAEFAQRVTIVVRGDSLAKAMSHYLVERIDAHPRILVRTRSRVIAAGGDSRLESILVADDAREAEEELPADALFILIGGQPLTAGVEGWLRRDEHGFLMTGPDLLEEGRPGRWPLERDPFFLESSEPGVFVAGDVRHGSIKRVASAVGEGAMAIALIHRYLSTPEANGGEPT